MNLERNPGQEQAISITEGPILVIAAPGAGKTTMAIRRIHHMVEDLGIPASSILMTTFSNAAAKDMSKKYIAMFGSNPGATFCTIHSLCFNILRYAGTYSLEDLLQEHEKQEFLFQYLKHAIKAENAWDLATSVATDFSVVKGNNIDPYGRSYEPRSMKKEEFLKTYAAYEEMKARKHRIDFDDILIECFNLLTAPGWEGYLDSWRKKFRYIICDEYQDTNYVQRDILYTLAGEERNLCVVGDDDQSIYMFRGARPEIMRSFPKDNPGCVEIDMGINYRSGRNIVAFCEKIIKRNKKRLHKKLVSWRGEAGGFEGDAGYYIFPDKEKEMRFVSEKAQAFRKENVPWEEMAILVRTNAQAGQPVMELSKLGIPFYCMVTVKSKYEDFIYRDLSAYIRLSCGIANEYDFGQVLNHPSRYLRESEMRKADEYSEAGLCLAATYLLKDSKGGDWRYNKAEASIQIWMENFGPGKLTLESPPGLAFEKLEKLGYRAYIKQYCEFRKLDEQEYKDQYAELLKDARQCGTIGEWFEMAEKEVTAYREFNRRKDTGGIRISTFHKAKGQEYKVVFVTGVMKGVVPHKNSQKTTDEVEEERRALYVACSRAADHLFVTCPSLKGESPFMVGFPKENEEEVKKFISESKGRASSFMFVYSNMRKKYGFLIADGRKATIIYGTRDTKDAGSLLDYLASRGENVEKSIKEYPDCVKSGEISIIKSIKRDN